MEQLLLPSRVMEQLPLPSSRVMEERHPRNRAMEQPRSSSHHTVNRFLPQEALILHTANQRIPSSSNMGHQVVTKPHLNKPPRRLSRLAHKAAGTKVHSDWLNRKLIQYIMHE